jgi:hypothetical protein
MTPGQPYLRLRVFPSGLRTFRHRSIYFPSTLLSPLHVEKLYVSPPESVEELVVLRLEVEFCHWRSSGVWSELLGRARICLRHFLIPLTLGPASECFLLTEPSCYYERRSIVISYPKPKVPYSRLNYFLPSSNRSQQHPIVWKFDERKSDGSETDYSRRGGLSDLRVSGIALRAKTTVYNRRTEAIGRPRRNTR